MKYCQARFRIDAMNCGIFVVSNWKLINYLTVQKVDSLRLFCPRSKRILMKIEEKRAKPLFVLLK